LKLRFWLPHEDFHNPTRKRVDVNIDISSLTRRVMKKIATSKLTRRVINNTMFRVLVGVIQLGSA
jgi:hypothetical protein